MSRRNRTHKRPAPPNHNVKGSHIMATSRIAKRKPEPAAHISPGTQSLCLDALEEKFNDIVCVALGALAHQETRSDEYKDEVTCSLLRIIQEQAKDSTKFRNELRTMLETLPKEVS